MKNSKLSIQYIVTIGLCTAVIAIMAQISIPMPMGVPMTMQTFAITLTGIILGAKRGALATFIYVLLGSVGVPIFAGFSGGFQALIGPTGGFLWSFPIMAFFIGLGAEKYRSSKPQFIFWLVFGTVINYVIGVIVFCLVTQSPVVTGITACVLPFIPTAVIKAVLASVLGLSMKERLVQTAWN